MACCRDLKEQQCNASLCRLLGLHFDSELEAVRSSETYANFYQSRPHHIPEEAYGRD
jgi:hypothetical protein